MEHKAVAGEPAADGGGQGSDGGVLAALAARGARRPKANSLKIQHSFLVGVS